MFTGLNIRPFITDQFFNTFLHHCLLLLNPAEKHWCSQFEVDCQVGYLAKPRPGEIGVVAQEVPDGLASWADAEVHHMALSSVHFLADYKCRKSRVMITLKIDILQFGSSYLYLEFPENTYLSMRALIKSAGNGTFVAAHAERSDSASKRPFLNKEWKCFNMYLHSRLHKWCSKCFIWVLLCHCLNHNFHQFSLLWTIHVKKWKCLNMFLHSRLHKWCSKSFIWVLLCYSLNHNLHQFSLLWTIHVITLISKFTKFFKVCLSQLFLRNCHQLAWVCAFIWSVLFKLKI